MSNTKFIVSYSKYLWKECSHIKSIASRSLESKQCWNIVAMELSKLFCFVSYQVNTPSAWKHFIPTFMIIKTSLYSFCIIFPSSSFRRLIVRKLSWIKSISIKSWTDGRFYHWKSHNLFNWLTIHIAFDGFKSSHGQVRSARANSSFEHRKIW